MKDTSQLVTTKSVGIHYGLYTSVASIFIFLGMALMGVDVSSSGQWVNYPVYIVLIVLAHKYFKDSGDGFLTYGQGLNIAFWLSLVYSFIYSTFTYVYVKFIDGALIELMKEKQFEKLQEAGLPADQLEQAIKITTMFMKPEVLLFLGIIGGIISIVVIGLIVTLFTQEKNPDQVY